MKTMIRCAAMLLILAAGCMPKKPAATGTNTGQSGGGGGHIAGVLVGAHLPETGCVSDTIFHHESILRLSLRALGVEEFPGAAATAPDLGEFFVAEH